MRSSNMPKMLLRGWWMLHTTVCPEEARFFSVATTCAQHMHGVTPDAVYTS
jgi:hypothetical protein